jgi:putative transposase
LHLKSSFIIDAQLAIDTLNQAIKIRKTAESLIFHSDQSGYPYDNAVTEVFFKYLKQRCINQTSFHSLQEVKLACFEYIESFYNNYNPHTANNELTPNQKEKSYFENTPHWGSK